RDEPRDDDEREERDGGRQVGQRAVEEEAEERLRQPRKGTGEDDAEADPGRAPVAGAPPRANELVRGGAALQAPARRLRRQERRTRSAEQRPVDAGHQQ